MKLLENTKFTGAALLLLLALNSALLVVLIVKKPGPPPMRAGERPPGPPAPGNTAEFLTYELKLDDKQQEQYQELIQAHREKVSSLEDDIRDLRDSMITEMENTPPDSTKINALAKKVGEKQALIETTTMDHFRDLRAICTPEQQKKFSRVIREGLHRLGPQGGPHPGGPQGPPPPGMQGPPPQGPPPPGAQSPPPPPGQSPPHPPR